MANTRAPVDSSQSQFANITVGISERCALFYSDLKSALQETERFKARNWTVFANHAKGNDLLDLGPDIGKVRFPSSAEEIPNILIMGVGLIHSELQVHTYF